MPVVGLTVVISLLAGIALYQVLPWQQHEIATRVIMLVSLAAGLYSAYRVNRDSIVQLLQKKRAPHPQRIRQKMWVLSGLWLLTILFSSVLYHILDQALYVHYTVDALRFAPLILLVLYVWIVFFDQRQPEPHDAYVAFFLAIQHKKIPWQQHKLFILTACVKIFFIPFIYGATYLAISQIIALDNIFQNPVQLIQFLFLFGLCFDVTIALGGYLFSSQYFATQTLSVDDSWQGWLVCVLCYPPLFLYRDFLTRQVDNYVWSDWLASDQVLYWLWAAVICATWICYWLATLSFGFRFSNLSWRGLVNTGLYRYVKHPAYLSKNIYWWLHTVPLFGVMGWDMLRNCAALACISLIYYLRAKTEERHLMRFAEYRDYQAWMAEHGLWAKIKKGIRRA